MRPYPEDPPTAHPPQSGAPVRLQGITSVATSLGALEASSTAVRLVGIARPRELSRDRDANEPGWVAEPRSLCAAPLERCLLPGSRWRTRAAPPPSACRLTHRTRQGNARGTAETPRRDRHTNTKDDTEYGWAGRWVPKKNGGQRKSVPKENTGGRTNTSASRYNHTWGHQR